jgi:hypothetical protein
MGKYIVEWGRSQMTIWRIRIAYWITDAKNTYSEYGVHIVFSLQQWLQEGAPVLRYMCIACFRP